jgi:phospholipid/cholesterol/gamma-HCH transport system ATP-binding protein
MADEPIIRASGLYKRFGDHEVLKGLSLDVRQGTTTVILGSSGSGKSVFMKHLIGLLTPDAGQVLIEGEDLHAASLSRRNEIRTQFGMVFQAAALFDSLTVYENVAFPLEEHRKSMSRTERRDKVYEKLEILGLARSATKYPAELSGGMRKRAGLARAVVMDPKLVLYDEPTTGLDPLTTESVDEMIVEASEHFGVTSIVISHDITSALRIADAIAFLHDGRIVEEGPPGVINNSEHPMVSRFFSTWREGLKG